MQRTAVTSSQIKSIGFENGDDGDVMEIEFHPKPGKTLTTAEATAGADAGPVYRYTGEKVFEHYTGLLEEGKKDGGSLGIYFAKNIRHCKLTKCERLADL